MINEIEIQGWARDLRAAGLTVQGQRDLEATQLWQQPAGFWDAVEAEIARLEAEPRPLFWPFGSSGDAYDACQCDARIKSGDLLVIASEGIVGMAWAWPVAITVEHGTFHTASDASVITDADGMGASADQLAAAIEKCHELRFPVDPLYCN